MATKDIQQAPPDAFPIPLAEYVGSLPKGNIEMAKAFLATYPKDSGPKPAQEWSALFGHFGNKPDGVSWSEWEQQLTATTEVSSDGK